MCRAAPDAGSYCAPGKRFPCLCFACKREEAVLRGSFKAVAVKVLVRKKR